MVEKQVKGMTPTKLRLILIGVISMLIILAGVGFWLFSSQLSAYAEQVSKDAAQANVSANDISRLEKLKTQLEDDAVAITRTKNIVADSQSYQYQNQIINDLSIYAKNAGVVVSSYSFDSSTSASGEASPSATAPAPSAETTAPVAADGLKTTNITVTLKSPADYKAVMRFVHSIESNLTKMQLSGISIAQASEDKNMVTTNPLTIQVYTR
jgi:hypothetical protein